MGITLKLRLPGMALSAGLACTPGGVGSEESDSGSTTGSDLPDDSESGDETGPPDETGGDEGDDCGGYYPAQSVPIWEWCELDPPPFDDPGFEPDPADPEDDEPPALIAAEMLDGHTVALTFSEPIGPLDDVDPTSFRLAFQAKDLQADGDGGGITCDYIEPLMTRYESTGTVTRLRHEPGIPNRLILELSAAAPEACDEFRWFQAPGHPSWGPCMPIGWRLFYGAQPGAEPVRDFAGNVLEDWGSWWVDSEYGAQWYARDEPCGAQGFPVECPPANAGPFIAEIAFGSTTSELNVRFSTSIAVTDGLSPSQFRIGFDEGVGQHGWLIEDPRVDGATVVVTSVEPTVDQPDSLTLTLSHDLLDAECVTEQRLAVGYAAVGSACHGDIIDAEGRTVHDRGAAWVLDQPSAQYLGEGLGPAVHLDVPCE